MTFDSFFFVVTVLVFFYCFLTSGGYQHLRPSTNFMHDVLLKKSLSEGSTTTLHFPRLRDALLSHEISNQKVCRLLEELCNLGFESDAELESFSRDFEKRPEVLSDLLQKDMKMSAIDAHVLRSAFLYMLHHKNSDNISADLENSIKTGNSTKHVGQYEYGSKSARTVDGKRFKEFAVSRTKKNLSTTTTTTIPNSTTLQSFNTGEKSVDNYALQISNMPLTLSSEIKEFQVFMTEVNLQSQEAPIKMATAKTYITHTLSFLGWFINVRMQSSKNDGSMTVDLDSLSLQTIFPSKERESIQVILDFLKWLKLRRSISVSYEANIIRGLTKLCKFRFCTQSVPDPSLIGRGFDDIPAIKELRRLHREAGRKQKLSPRASDEKKKWISWIEYLNVVHTLKTELDYELDVLAKMQQSLSSPHIVQGKRKATASFKSIASQTAYASKQRYVAQLYQRYLLLAFFSCVPDRQRTFRELEIGRTFLRHKLNADVHEGAPGSKNIWVIKHSADDYKTGKSYGERPPLIISQSLTSAIDDFICQWRPLLNPKTNILFAQPKTGKPLTQDSIYQMVSRVCFNLTGKKTNPHLLRDSIVTHVRQTNASERELEALALYMGHSVSMQRTSYDRRTLAQKVDPAVNLLASISDSITQNLPKKV